MRAGLISLIIGAGIVGLLLYWQLVIAEGAYLGRRVVVWLYDLTASRYDRIKGFNPDDEAVFLGRPLVEALRGDRPPLVLDVGTGTGRLPLALFEQPTFQGRVIGLDASRRMLALAAEKTSGYRNRLDLIWDDAGHLPFADATFDAVACLEMLEFAPDPVAQLAELARVLKPGGLLLATRRRGAEALLMPGKTHQRDDFAALLRRVGLEQVSIEPWTTDYDLAWGVRASDPDRPAMGGARPLVEVLCCPRCGRIELIHDDSLICVACGARYPVRDGVVELMRLVPLDVATPGSSA
jgi:ubiquinone/menaquinone biosynthesis C-methylase UbiE